mmetsp:Transcript_59071/g.117394  ORF Transcript_59071/g.117394 Transcript_59071/m.117394 type:complete len:248 (+) Transcript_59071:430-1173(+)
MSSLMARSLARSLITSYPPVKNSFMSSSPLPSSSNISNKSMMSTSESPRSASSMHFWNSLRSRLPFLSVSASSKSPFIIAKNCSCSWPLISAAGWYSARAASSARSRIASGSPMALIIVESLGKYSRQQTWPASLVGARESDTIELICSLVRKLKPEEMACLSRGGSRKPVFSLSKNSHNRSTSAATSPKFCIESALAMAVTRMPCNVGASVAASMAPLASKLMSAAAMLACCLDRPSWGDLSRPLS